MSVFSSSEDPTLLLVLEQQNEIFFLNISVAEELERAGKFRHLLSLKIVDSASSL